MKLRNRLNDNKIGNEQVMKHWRWLQLVAMDAHHCLLCVAELRVTLHKVQVLGVAQECFHGEFTSPATIKCTLVFVYN